MQKNILIIFVFIFYSCTFLENSAGEFNEVIIIASPEDRELIIPNIDKLFSKTIITPQLEKEFDIFYKNPWEIEEIKKNGNIIILSLEFPIDSTGDLLAKRMDSKNDNSIYLIEDLFSKYQRICVIKSKDIILMENLLKEYEDWILSQFRENQELRIKDKLYSYGKNKNISQLIKNIFGFSVELQKDYKIIQSDSIKSFIWIGRGYPYRWLTFHKINKKKIKNINYAWNNIIKLFDSTITDINIVNDFRKNEILKYNGINRPIMRGLYEHKISDSGGPFFTYIFDTKLNNEVILISGFVNNPGYKKIHLLKQLEIIAFTIN